MSSLSVRFLTPPLSHAAPSSSARQRLFAGSLTVAQPVDAGRLERPRVDERDGYYVLKEKFRQGINPQEKVKIKTEPMKLFMENGIEELAKLSMEEIDKEKSSKDDIDVRLKWLGLLHRRKHRRKH
jgi:ferredoxin-nitrite reductase